MRADPPRLAVLCCLGLAACTWGGEATAPSRNPPDARPATGPVVAVTVACGGQVTTDILVENDLTCAGDGLIVMADDISINLNGHTLSGNGTGNGITVRGRSGVTIKNGVIRTFLTGVFVATSTGIIIKGSGFTGNREAVFLNGSTNSTIKANTAWANTTRGFMLRPTASGVQSTGNSVVGNVITDTPSGILVFGQPGNTIKGNTITGSTFAALDLTGGGATGNEFKDNLLSASAAGILLGPGWSGGNLFVGNTLASNTCGLKGTNVDNTFKDNQFIGNTTDACP